MRNEPKNQARTTPDVKWENERKVQFDELLAARRRLTRARENLDDLRSNINAAECEVKNAEIAYADTRRGFEVEFDPGGVVEKP
jgi:hypothetical protein